MKTLIVGFKRYAEHPSNPSEAVIQKLAARKDIVGYVLGVSYREVNKLPEIIEREKPDFIITMNLSPFRKEPAIEEYAYNELRSVQPDEEGVVKNGEAILADGPRSINSELDIPSIQQFLSSRGCSIAMSIDPGLWVCNQASYLARHSGLRSVSLHLPLEKDFPVSEDVEIVENILDYFEAL